MKFKFLIIVLACCSLLSCEEDQINEEEVVNATSENLISFSSSEGDFLFANDINVFNSYLLGPNQDQLSLVFMSDEGLICEIHILGAGLLERSLPVDLSDGVTGTAEVQLVDPSKDVESTFGPNDDVNFVGYTMQGLSFTVESFESDIIKGTFSGTISTRTGRQMTIQEGRFDVLVDIEDNR